MRTTRLGSGKRVLVREKFNIGSEDRDNKHTIQLRVLSFSASYDDNSEREQRSYKLYL